MKKEPGEDEKQRQSVKCWSVRPGLAWSGLVLSSPWVSLRGAWSRYAERASERGADDSWR